MAGATPLYQQLYSSLQAAILSGELKRATKVPSTRAMAAQQNVSRNTVLNAYSQLIAEGYLESIEGSGTFVARVLPDAPPATPRRRMTGARRAPLSQPQFSTHARRQMAAPQLFSAPATARNSSQPFQFGVPALDAFPYALWSRLLVRQARHMPSAAFGYQEAAGYRPLREAIAAHVAVSRGVRCAPDQIMIVSGSQGALDLAARMLINSGQAVWMEDPGYLAARGAFLGAGAQIVPVPVDEQGLDVEAGRKRAPRARLVYITPSHQFPLGVTMSLSRRLALLDWARQANAYILEDDYDSEYRFAGRPLAALQGIDDVGRVIYIGTFSKVLFPALRVGYLILPRPLIDAFLTVRRLIDVHTPVLEQAVLAEFMSAGHLARHLRRMRVLYAERRDALVEAAQKLPLEVHSPAAGMHCIGWLPAGLDETDVVNAAAAHGVSLSTISSFSIEPPARAGVVLGFSEYPVPVIREAMRRLAAALRSVRPARN